MCTDRSIHMYILQMYIGGVLLVELAVIGVVSGLVTGLVDDISRRRFIMGLLCVYSAFMMYLSRFFHVVRMSGLCVKIIRCIHNQNKYICLKRKSVLIIYLLPEHDVYMCV